MKILVKILIFACVAIILVGVLFYSSDNLKVCLQKNCFDVEVAKTDTERAQGLMNRETLDKNSGMLFVFDKEDIYTFWMKNTLIPLDIIWMDKNNKIVFVNENTPPCKSNETECPLINPGINAKFVLELNAGKVKEFGIKITDRLDFNF